MPTIYNEDGFRFHFFSLEHNPPHIHISKGVAKAKVNLIDNTLMENKGLKPQELKQVLEIVAEKRTLFIEKWNLYFNQ